MGRPGQPEEVSPAFGFFASEGDASSITGEVLTANGTEPGAAEKPPSDPDARRGERR
jgi:hypothetical protein